jgi:mannose-6-phosphate isomerase-like protein (cupin superfamily)
LRSKCSWIERASDPAVAVHHQYVGAKIDPHDHTFEESYFFVSGRVRATAEGKTYDLGPGDAIWTGVGCLHSFENAGAEPVRWIETQAPLPPAREVFRFEKIGRSIWTSCET